MSVWVIVGGQFGSEGKGKVAAYIARRERADFCVRCGGPNSGHSITDAKGRTEVFRQLPTGVVADVPRLLIAPGALIDPKVLKREIDHFGIMPGQLGVDRNCFMIEPSDRENERNQNLRERLGSTLSGVGAATSRRVMRSPDARTARNAAADHPWLAPLLTDVSAELNRGVDNGKTTVIEGTQGFGLSLYHSDHFPKCTSRDTTASAFLSEAGLAPSCAEHVVLVLRTFPIRVPGNSGPLAAEMTWEQLQAESGYPHPIGEVTSVTCLPRRVARFDWPLARRAVAANRPTMIALNGLDYLRFSDRGVQSWDDLSTRSTLFVREIESELNVPVCVLGTGPGAKELFSLRAPADTRQRVAS